MNGVGFPNLLQYSFFERSISTTRTALNTATQELVTGQKANLSQALGAQAGEFNIVNKSLKDLDDNASRLGLGLNRFDNMNLAVKTMRETLAGFSSRVVSDLTLTGNIGEVQTRETAEAHLKVIMSALNTSHAGRSLFAGDEVGSRAVLGAEDIFAGIDAVLAGSTDPGDIDAAITAYFDPAGGFETDIYQGGAGNAASLFLSNGNSADYSFKADDQVFRDLMEGLTRLVYLPQGDIAWGEQAATMIRVAEEELIEVQANIGRQQTVIENALKEDEAQRLILTDTQFRLAGVDSTEAAGRVQRLEIQLEAAFTLTARLSQLTLTNYIR